MMLTNRTVHKWTIKDREYLVLLKLKYSRKLIAPIFNHLLSRTLTREGFRRGISAPALDAQYQEIKAGGKGHDIFAKINGLSDQRVEFQYRVHLRDIREAARTLKLRLEPTNPAKRSTKTSPREVRKARMKRKIRIRRSETRDTPTEVATNHNNSALRRQAFANKVSPFFSTNTPVRDAKSTSIPSSHTRSDGIISPALRITHDSNGNKVQQRPLLLFRSTDNPNVIRARRYLDINIDVPNPDAFNSIPYRDVAIPHLQRCHAWHSPFLSFTQTARDAISRVERARSERIDKKKFLVVFAFNDIEANARRNFGQGAGPHLVSTLFPKGEESFLPNGYTGTNEWLIWGYVDCEPLLVLDSAQVIELARALRRFRRTDVTALTDIKVCLQGVPLKWRQAVAYVMLRSYCGKNLPDTKSPAYQQIMQIIVDDNAISALELQNFSRLSVTNEDPMYEQEDAEEGEEEEDTEGNSQYLANTHHPVCSPRFAGNPVEVSSPNSREPVPKPKEPTVLNLNSFNAKLVAARQPDRATNTTPLWSPSPSEIYFHNPAVSQPSSVPADTVSQQNATNTEDENEWDFVNDDLEDFFAKSFPSAAKRVEHLQKASSQYTHPLTDFDDEEEEELEDAVVDDDYVVPSIEVGDSYDLPTSHGRGNLLRGLTAHANSEGSPIETPSKPPRKVTKLPPQDKTTTIANLNHEVSSINRIPKSSIFETPKSTRTTHTPLLSFGRRPPPPVIDLTKVDPVQTRATIANSKASTDRSQRLRYDPKPNTTVRTKVPVIVRKSIVDDSV